MSPLPRVLCLLALTLVWVCPGTLEAATAVWLGAAAGAPGTTAPVPVNLTTDTNVVKAQFDLVYPPTYLRAGTPVGGGALADQLILTSEPAPGVRRVQLVSFSNSPMTNGVMVFIPVAIATNAPAQAVSLVLTNLTLTNAQNQLVQTLPPTNGTFLIGAQPVFLSLVSLSSGGVHLELSAPPECTCVLQAATNPLGAPWLSLATNQPVNGRISFDETLVPRPALRFYRAYVPP